MRSAFRLVPAVAFVAALAAVPAVTVPLGGCTGVSPRSSADSSAAARVIAEEVRAAYDLSRPNPVANLMALYAPTGPIVSASAGRVITSRDTLRQGIQAFADNVLRNMRQARVEWTSMHVDVLAPNAAVMTATYRIPHVQPNGMQHVIGGAWTAAFQRRGARWYIVQEHLSDAPMLR